MHTLYNYSVGTQLAEELESSNDDIGSLEVKIQQTVDSLEHEVEAVRQSSRRAEVEAAKATANARELGTLNAALVSWYTHLTWQASSLSLSLLYTS